MLTPTPELKYTSDDFTLPPRASLEDFNWCVLTWTLDHPESYIDDIDGIVQFVVAPGLLMIRTTSTLVWRKKGKLDLFSANLDIIEQISPSDGIMEQAVAYTEDYLSTEGYDWHTYPFLIDLASRFNSSPGHTLSSGTMGDCLANSAMAVEETFQIIQEDPRSRIG